MSEIDLLWFNPDTASVVANISSIVRLVVADFLAPVSMKLVATEPAPGILLSAGIKVLRISLSIDSWESVNIALIIVSLPTDFPCYF